MSTFYQPPLTPGPGVHQFPAVHPQPNLQTGSYRDTPGYYRPRTGNAISSSYDYVAERVRDNPDGPPSVGVHEAKHWYSQAYQLGALNSLSSWELGHAAAYCAYRMLREDPPTRGSGYERERLIGLAVTEASKLMRESGREREIDAGTAASETAARTASRIFDQTRFPFPDEYRSRPSYGTRTYTDPYDYHDDEYDDNDEYLRRPRSRTRRGRSLSRTRHPMFADSPSVIPNAFPGYASSVAHSNDPVETPREGIPRPVVGPKYPPTPHPGSAYTSGSIVISYPGTAASNTVLPQAYQGPRVHPSHHNPATYDHLSRPRSASFSYSQQPYSHMPQPMYPPPSNAYPGNTPYYTAPEQTIVIQRPRKHRHKHRHHHRSRSR